MRTPGADVLREDLIYSLDPVEYCRDMGFEPDGWQERMLRSTSKGRIACTSRQAGKSTIIGVLASHWAKTKKDQVVLTVAPTQRQSGLLFHKIKKDIEDGPIPYIAKKWSETSVALGNGSVIYALPANPDTIRGYSANLVIIDEAAFVEDDVMQTIRPMVAVTGGTVILISTPYIRDGFFFEIMEKSEGWEKYRVPWQECPRITEEFIATEKAQMPEFWFTSEYCAQFQDPEANMFPTDVIDRAFMSDDEAITFGAPGDGDAEILFPGGLG